MPTDVVLEINDKGTDINRDFGGRYVRSFVVLTISYNDNFSYVWLIAEFNSNPDYACNSFAIITQDSSDDKRQDLAKGAGGQYRYLVPYSTPAERKKVTEIRLFRSDSAIGSPPPGYDGMTGDINRDRGKSFLYVIWKHVIV